MQGLKDLRFRVYAAHRRKNSFPSSGSARCGARLRGAAVPLAATWRGHAPVQAPCRAAAARAVRMPGSSAAVSTLLHGRLPIAGPAALPLGQPSMHVVLLRVAAGDAPGLAPLVVLFRRHGVAAVGRERC